MCVGRARGSGVAGEHGRRGSGLCALWGVRRPQSADPTPTEATQDERATEARRSPRSAGAGAARLSTCSPCHACGSPDTCSRYTGTHGLSGRAHRKPHVIAFLRTQARAAGPPAHHTTSAPHARSHASQFNLVSNTQAKGTTARRDALSTVTRHAYAECKHKTNHLHRRKSKQILSASPTRDDSSAQIVTSGWSLLARHALR